MDDCRRNIIVKLKDHGLGIRYFEKPPPKSAWQWVLDNGLDLKYEKMLPDLSHVVESVKDKLSEKKYELLNFPDFESFFSITVSDNNSLYEVFLNLSLVKDENIDYVYIEPIHAPSPSNQCPVSENYEYQRYLELAPIGVGAKKVREIKSFISDKVRIIDIEQGWLFEHKELSRDNVSGFPDSCIGVNRYEHIHGTNVLGILISDATDGYGHEGISAGFCDVDCVSIWKEGECCRYNVAYAFATALNTIDSVDSGVTILIEAQKLSLSPDGCCYYMPVESEKIVFDLIKLATNYGVTVIEAAGNGALDYCDYSFGVSCYEGAVDLDGVNDGVIVIPEYSSEMVTAYSDDILNIKKLIEASDYGLVDNEIFEFDYVKDNSFKPVLRSIGEDESGAILVASASLESNAWQRSKNTCFGSRIDCFAMGAAVSALSARIVDPPPVGGGYERIISLQNQDNDQHIYYETDLYTSCFSGTSSASAIVAGVVGVVQGLYSEKNNSTFLSPSQVSQMLLSNATSSANADEKIGVMPNLKAICEDNDLLDVVDSTENTLEDVNNEGGRSWGWLSWLFK